MKKILIFGSGSIGNHMAYASKKLNFDVFITDKNPDALKRMKKEIYPKRYGKWDNQIKQINFLQIRKINKIFDLVIIGTPPETHSKLYDFCKKNIKFKKLLIEKPIFHINEKKIKSLKKSMKPAFIFCGYNHSISPSFENFYKYVFKKIKKIKKIDVKWCEAWDGILNAHFWLKSQFDSYLGDYKKGGGSLQEHSHGLHLLSLLLKEKKINLLKTKIFTNSIFNKRNAKYDFFSTFFGYDKQIYFSYETDLITQPAEKKITLYESGKKYEWICNYKKGLDIIKKYSNNKLEFKKIFKKTRSSEFENEIKHIMNIKNLNQKNKSNLNPDHAIDVVNFIKKRCLK